MVTAVEHTVGDTIAHIECGLGLTPREIAAGLGVSPHTLERWRKGESFPQREVQQRLEALRTLNERVLDFFAGNGGAGWLRARNHYLSGLTPVEMIHLGHFDRVENSIGMIEHGIFQ